MPIIKSAKKQLRQSQKNKSRNDHFRSLYRESRIAFENAIKAKDIEKAKQIYVNIKSED
jgi:ribosomal protein S20